MSLPASSVYIRLRSSCFVALLLLFKTFISSLAPSLSISLFESCNSSSEWHLAMKSQMILHPLEVILLLDKLKTCKLCLFLFYKALITISTPSSPMLFPLRLSSLIVLLKDKQSSRVLIPWYPISFFLRLNTSRYFLSFND